MNPSLAERAVVCPGWRWMPGMLALAPDGRGLPQHPVFGEWNFLPATRLRVLAKNEAQGPVGAPVGWLPDFDDAATLGCFEALVREVGKCPDGHLVPKLEGFWCFRAGLHGWRTSVCSSPAEALVEALEALGGTR